MAGDNFNLDIVNMQKRLKSVLIYDEIAENKMNGHLANLLQVSNSVAKRMLDGEHKTILRRGIHTCVALNVSVFWLFFGRLDHFNDREQRNRTMRIHVQAYKGYSKEITDNAMKFLFANIAGHRKAINLMNMINKNQISYVEALHIF